MTAYKLNHKRSPNQSSRQSYGYGSKPTGITIHHWGSTGQKHANVVNYLTRTGGNTSAHLVCSAGLVTRLVDDDRAAWHAGSTPGNGSTIGIECRPEMSDGDWDTLVQLCADLEEKHGSLKYFKHSDWKNTACPGKYAGRIGELVAAVNAEHTRRKTGGKPAPAPRPSKPTQPKPAGRVPGPGYDFPFEAGGYIGPKSGPNRSHSGMTGRITKGVRDSTWIKRFVDQLARRGWSVGRGKTWLSRFGNDGKYGSELEALIRAFQREQGLPVDGLAGERTWNEAFKEPVT